MTQRKKIETFEILWPVDREKEKMMTIWKKLRLHSLAPVFVREGRGGLNMSIVISLINYKVKETLMKTGKEYLS